MWIISATYRNLRYCRYLEKHGIAPRASLENYGLVSPTWRLLAVLPTSLLWYLAANCSANLRELMDDKGAVILCGPVRSGKSILLRSFMANDQTRSRYQRSFLLDCFVLRARSAEALERDAIWSLFVEDEERGRRFAIPARQRELWPPKLVDKPFAGGPLSRYLQAELPQAASC